MICHKHLGILAVKEGRPRDAVPEFQKALRAAEKLLRSKPNDKNLLRNAAELADWCGNKSRAQELHERARTAGR
jgi:hypothetical protein